MKKIISVILILVCLGVFAGCAAEGAAPAAVPTGGTAANYEFAARYARTNGYIEDAGYPFVNIIRSHDELMAYYEANRDKFDLDSEVLKMCDAYDDAYFAANSLILVTLEETSGAISHEVTKVVGGDEWTVTIKRDVPESFTDDMAEWHIFVEVKAANVIPENAAVNVVLE